MNCRLANSVYKCQNWQELIDLIHEIANFVAIQQGVTHFVINS